MSEGQGHRRRKAEYYFDYSLVFIILFLVGFGLVMLYSTSSYEAAQEYGDAAYWLKKQALWSAVGIAVMVFFSFFPYRILKKFAKLAYWFSAALIPCVLFFPKKNGARRWIYIGGFSIQPAEIAKICVILFFAAYISGRSLAIQSKKGFWMAFVYSLPHAIMIYTITNNLSSAIIVFGIAMAMLFVASNNSKRFYIMGGAAIAFAAIVVFVVKNFSDKIGFRGERILAWLDPVAYSSGKGYQTLQGLYAIGSGGIWGKGLGQSIQKMGFIPEAQNDMIFSIICEELGLFGALAIMIMFILLLWRLVTIVINTEDKFGALFVIGVIAHISIQVILNIAVVTNTVPNTGISLPFISYGGSAIIFQLMEIGICLNVARSIELKEA